MKKKRKKKWKLCCDENELKILNTFVLVYLHEWIGGQNEGFSFYYYFPNGRDYFTIYILSNSYLYAGALGF